MLSSLDKTITKTDRIKVLFDGDRVSVSAPWRLKKQNTYFTVILFLFFLLFSSLLYYSGRNGRDNIWYFDIFLFVPLSGKLLLDALRACFGSEVLSASREGLDHSLILFGNSKTRHYPMKEIVYLRYEDRHYGYAWPPRANGVEPRGIWLKGASFETAFFRAFKAIDCAEILQALREKIEIPDSPSFEIQGEPRNLYRALDRILAQFICPSRKENQLLSVFAENGQQILQFRPRFRLSSLVIIPLVTILSYGFVFCTFSFLKLNTLNPEKTWQILHWVFTRNPAALHLFMILEIAVVVQCLAMGFLALAGAFGGAETIEIERDRFKIKRDLWGRKCEEYEFAKLKNIRLIDPRAEYQMDLEAYQADKSSVATRERIRGPIAFDYDGKRQSFLWWGKEPEARQILNLLQAQLD